MSEYPSETAKYRKLTQPFCYTADAEPGVGVDIASQGDPVVPWATQLDLPPEEFAYYNSNHPPRGPIQLRGHGDKLPFDDNSLDFVYSSHLLEDYADWDPVLVEWVRVLKPEGALIILIPDKARWKAAMDRGQPPNDAHRHESYPGELTTYAEKLGIKVFMDQLVDFSPEDYTIIFVARKLAKV